MNLRRGILLRIAATLSTVLMMACVHALGGRVPTGEVVFFRSIFALLPILAWALAAGQLAQLARTGNLPGHFGRGLSGTGGMFFSYLALAFIPLAQATAFSYAAPLFTVIFAAVLLREVVRIYRWSAVIVGFAGVLVMLVPALAQGGAMAGGTLAIGAGAALAAAACAALSAIQIRHMTATEAPGTIVFWFAVMTTVIGLATLPFGWVLPAGTDLALLIGCGLFGGLNQLLITLSLRDAPASALAPFDYGTMVWSILAGLVLFGTAPDGYTLAGAVVIAAAGLFTLWRERRRAAIG